MQTDNTNQLHSRQTVQISCTKDGLYKSAAKSIKIIFQKTKKNFINKLKFIEKNFKKYFFSEGFQAWKTAVAGHMTK